MENRSCQTNLTSFFLLLFFFSLFKSRITNSPSEVEGFAEDMEKSNGSPGHHVMFSYKKIGKT